MDGEVGDWMAGGGGDGGFVVVLLPLDVVNVEGGRSLHPCIALEIFGPLLFFGGVDSGMGGRWVFFYPFAVFVDGEIFTMGAIAVVSGPMSSVMAAVVVVIGGMAGTFMSVTVFFTIVTGSVVVVVMSSLFSWLFQFIARALILLGAFSFSEALFEFFQCHC